MEVHSWEGGQLAGYDTGTGVGGGSPLPDDFPERWLWLPLVVHTFLQQQPVDCHMPCLIYVFPTHCLECVKCPRHGIERCRPYPQRFLVQ